MDVAHGVVAAGDPQTAEAGARLLRDRGNAVDAIVAAAFASFVCELPLCSPLGGGVCLLERNASSPPLAFDMFSRTPGLGLPAGNARDFEAISVSFGAASQVFHVGHAAVAVPLALDGLLELHRRFGIRPLADVLAPAVDLGRSGFVLGHGVAFACEALRPMMARSEACRALFLDPTTGDIAKTGALLTNSDLATVVEDIGRDPKRVRDVYAALADAMGPKNGGLITERDLEAARMVDHEPVVVDHGGWRLSTMPSPSSGGVLVALGLRLLEGVSSTAFLSRDHLLTVGRAQEAMLAERDETFAERCADPARVRTLLSDERLLVARAHARSNILGSTTHLSAIDGNGMAVSLTLTNGEGCGHVVPGTGMIGNNLLGEEDLHPRGFHRDPPGTPLCTMMAPTLLSRGDDRIALGSGGSNRLRTAILQTLVGLIEHRVSPTDAVSAPRIHLELVGGAPRLCYEAAGLAPEVIEALQKTYPNHVEFPESNLYFGGVHLAMRTLGTFDGVGDPRRGGARVVV